MERKTRKEIANVLRQRGRMDLARIMAAGPVGDNQMEQMVEDLADLSDTVHEAIVLNVLVNWQGLGHEIARMEGEGEEGGPELYAAYKSLHKFLKRLQELNEAVNDTSKAALREAMKVQKVMKDLNK